MDMNESRNRGIPDKLDLAEPTNLLECCKQTIDLHSKNNSMMICSVCKQIIKCFNDQKSFNNYQRFCQSRHRKILATNYSDLHIVVFNSYETYTT